MTEKFVLILLFLFIITVGPAFAQKDSTGFWIPSKVYNKKRVSVVTIGFSSLYAASMFGLYFLWYQGNGSQPFTFFNDNREWLQMGKVGHIISSYYIGKYSFDMMNWAGVERRKAIWMGGSFGSVILGTIEVFDGFSSQYGFSWGDIVANSTGSILITAQLLAWNEQRILFRYSFIGSPEWKLRKEQLGSNLGERLIKDYYSITYWLSFNIHSFLHKESRFPRWLNVAVGYGANGMLGSLSNPVSYNGITFPKIERYRQYYLSFDIQLSKIRTKSKALKTIFSAFDFLKFPLPALEYDRVNGLGFYLFNKH